MTTSKAIFTISIVLITLTETMKGDLIAAAIGNATIAWLVFKD